MSSDLREAYTQLQQSHTRLQQEATELKIELARLKKEKSAQAGCGCQQHASADNNEKEETLSAVQQHDPIVSGEEDTVCDIVTTASQ